MEREAPPGRLPPAHQPPLFPPGTVPREKWDVDGGRADVIDMPELASRFVAEIKWRTTRWKAHETAERDHLAQAANYTATGPPFALLLVGDASDHSLDTATSKTASGSSGMPGAPRKSPA
ncbi:hypothetical protein ACFY78_10735 [Streptomyces olindensis]|uniref:hypothetical protein n=1 Tax=Streptomyces olindensis TaxID=358823 RepID=UPI00369CA2BC